MKVYARIIKNETEQGFIFDGGSQDRREFLRQLEDETLADYPPGYLDNKEFTFMSVSLSCGCIFSYKSHNDVPLEDVACEHGNKAIIWE